ncbi:MAG: T9SS type A sorting domain-containing protein [Balneolaceae bacterium]
MMKATIKKAATLCLGLLIMAGFSVVTNAQNASFENGKFVFFIDGLNVQIPESDGTVTNDPLDPTSGNKVYEIGYADWSERGFRWSSNGEAGTVGIDASGATGENYGETDTLYFRLWSDSLNKFQNDFIVAFDTENGALLGEDLPFRMRWRIPDWAHNEQWHDFAIPLPPSTYAALDSAKAGKKLNGDALDVEVDSLFANWGYDGAWASGSAAGVFDGPSDPNFMEFQWNSVKYFGRHIDHAGGVGGSIYLDYFSIGVPPEQLVDEAPAALASIDVSNASGVNTISWGAGENVGGYNVYFSESAITDVLADGVEQLGSVAFDGELSFDHELTAPHPNYAAGFEAHYAVTASSNFGSESAAAAGTITSDIKVSPYYASELSTDAVDAVFGALEADAIPDAATMAGFFPDGYQPFTIAGDSKVIENGDGGDDDNDISSKYWIGFDPTDNSLIVYAEVTDDIQVFATVATGSGGAWNFDSWEMGLANYTPESFIQGSTHQNFESGADPDYQFRGGKFSDGDGFIHANGGGANVDGEVPNSQTIFDASATGYRTLSVLSTIELSGGETEDKAFDFPSGDEVTLYPFNVTINDNDGTARDTQVGWSKKGGDDTWWNTPAKWTVVAFAGIDAGFVVSNEGEDNTTPEVFTLDQNYPNPFNPSTNINFTLGTTTEVTLEVFNMLGQKVATLLQNERMTSGQHSQKFNASSLSSGMYVYRLSTPSFVQSRKMMLIK